MKSGIGAVVALLLLTGCAQLPMPRPTTALPDLDAYVLERTDGGNRPPEPVAVEAAADILQDFDVVVLAELHDHPGNHIAQMSLYRALQLRTGAVDLSLEQFERDTQTVVDDYLAGRIGEHALKQKGRAWDNYDSDYRPLVEYAKDHHLTVIAANAPNDIVRCISQKGPEFLDQLAPARRSQVAAELNLDDGPYKAKFMGFATGDPSHGGGSADAPSPTALRSFAAQVSRDDTMAEAIVEHLKTHPEHKVVHLTGTFHAASFLGTVERIKQLNPVLRVAVVNPILVDAPEHPSITAEDAKTGTFVLMLRTLPEAYASDAEEEAAMGKQMERRGDLKCEL